jgi:CO/xanthine dehydrogenase FAD-binding subunit
VTLSNLIALLTAAATPLPPALAAKYLALVAHLQRVANAQVRNVGCWAGNLMLGTTN